ncbi:MAG: GNAT family N-acetyltransferase [Rhodospirillales bacterium]|nr:GNAT family N-acetyltransferase [Rhodospirillales bacterium]
MDIKQYDSVPDFVQNALHEGFEEHARETTGDGRNYFCLTLEEGGVIKAACHGYSYTDDLYISQLWVDKSLRGTGMGRRLMDEATSIGRERGCGKSWVDTYSYQAPEFYLKLGFEEYERIRRYRGPYDRIFFRKLI